LSFQPAPTPHAIVDEPFHYLPFLELKKRM
jgi:hypothetical protein